MPLDAVETTYTQNTPEQYMQEMARRGRLLVIGEEGFPWTLVTFFVLRSWEEEPHFHDRPQWTTPDDAPDGEIIYVDMLGGLVWNRRLLRHVETQVVSHVPSARYAVWYHIWSGGEKRYTYRRGGHYVPTLHR